MIQLSFPTKKLKEYIKRVNVKLKDTNYNQDDLTVYGVTNTEGITITGNQTSEDLSNYIVLKENQLAYNPYRVNVGSIGLAPKGLLGLVSPAYIVFETTEELSAEFLYYYLKSSLGVNLIKWYGDRGGVRSALRYNDLCEIDIPDLNLNQQMSVLKKMKEANTEIDEFNNEVHCQEQLISKLRQSILQEAVQGKLVPQDPNDEPASVLLERIKEEKERLIKEGKIKKEKPLPPISEDEIPYELPNGWKWARLGEVLYSTEAGKSPNCVDNPVNGDEWGVIKTTAIQKNAFLENENKILPKDFPLRDKYKININDVLITRAGPKNRVGIVCCVNELTKNLILSDKTVRLTLSNDLISHKYISLALNSKPIRPFIEQKMTGMAESQVNISQNDMRNFPIPIPPLNEQKRIVEKVDQLMALCDELEKNIEQSKKDSELLMQSILQEAFKEA